MVRINLQRFLIAVCIAAVIGAIIGAQIFKMILGYDIKGEDSWETGEFFACRHVCPADGILESISVYIKNTTAWSQYIDVGVYNDNAGVVGTKLIKSGGFEIPPNFNGWKTINILAGLVHDSAYWLTFILDTSAGPIYVYKDSGDTNQAAYAATWPWGSWPDNPAGLSYYANRISVYATFILYPVSPYAWGAMYKSQIDNEKIEEAINRLIAEHESDSDSHLGAGKSLEAHRASEIIDHPAGSILADKVSFTEVITHCSFESLDCWAKSNIAWVTVEFGDTVLLAAEYGVETPTYIQRDLKWAVGFTDYDTNWMFQFIAWTNYDTGTTARVIMGGVAGSDGFGFEFANGVVRGFLRNGASYTYTANLSIDHTALHLYRAFYDKTQAKFIFYVDGVEKASISKSTAVPNEEPQVRIELNATSDIGDEINLYVKSLITSIEI